LTNVLQLVPDKLVIVLDMAPYHRKRIPGTVMPKKSWRKDRIVEWFNLTFVPLQKNVKDWREIKIASLITLSPLYPVKEEFVVEQLARECGKDVKILFLLVAHCELNPIELI
jgi:hypothetical protein